MVTDSPRSYTVLESQAGKRLDAILGTLWPDISRSYGKKLILEGAVFIDDELVTTPKFKLEPGHTIEVRLPQATPFHLSPQAMDLDVVYEDEQVLVLNKPAGLVVHPGAGNTDHTLVHGLLHHCGGTLSGISGTLRPGIVHRLDKETSGLMVVAKTNEAHGGLAAQFGNKSISRSYLALVHGLVEPAQGTFRGNIGRSTQNRKKMTVVSVGGKEAVTHYTRLSFFAPYNISLVECQLETGRTHQIRVHFSHNLHPLVGDTTYGRGKKGRKIDQLLTTLQWPADRQALHAYRLRFIHPTTQKTLAFEVPLPPGMQQLLGRLSP